MMTSNNAPRVTIYDKITDDIGWQPMKHLVRLMADILDAQVIDGYKQTSYGKFSKDSFCRTINKLAYRGPIHRKRYPTGSDAIVIAETMCTIDHDFLTILKNKHNRVVLWIQDAFQESLIYPQFSYLAKFVDHIFITYGSDLDIYREKTGVSTSFLAFGADVLQLGGSEGDRPIDILRFGRQPDFLSCDDTNLRYFERAGLSYQGRPPYDTSFENMFHHYMKKSRYALASSNLVDSSNYTHPTKEYMTVRMFNIIASGCILVGHIPKTDYVFEKYLWPEAYNHVDLSGQGHTHDDIINAIDGWSPEIAEYNYKKALKNLDWRWRVKEIMSYLSLSSDRLDAELALIEQKI